MSASLTQLIGGSFQDAEGNLIENGYLTLKLSQDASVAGVGTICSGIEITIQLDSNGNVASSTSTPPAANQFAWANGNLSPVNTFYKVTGYTAEGQRAFGPNNQQIGTGSIFNLDAWIPNTVLSWFPSVQTTTFEVNGSPSSASGTLNLEAGNNITLTDEGGGTVQIAASGSSFSGNGAYFYGPGITDLSSLNATNATSGGTMNTSSGQVVVYLFELLSEFTVSKASIIALGNQVGVHGYFGIYSLTGNKLVDGGQFNNLTAGPVQTNTFTAVTLPPGLYWHAHATNSTNAGQYVGIPVNDHMYALLTENATRAAYAANALSGAALPTTLGALTPFVPTSSNGDCVFCPLYE